MNDEEKAIEKWEYEKNSIEISLIVFLLVGLTILAPFSREQRKEQKKILEANVMSISKKHDGSLVGIVQGVNPTISLIDTDADGKADYLRAGYFAGRNGYEFKGKVPDYLQEAYVKKYLKSKFYKEEK